MRKILFLIMTMVATWQIGLSQCSMTMPKDITVTNQLNTCQARVSYDMPTAKPCSGAESFSFTGNVQTFTVPAGVNVITIEAAGAGGGKATGFSSGIPGNGASIRGTVQVTPGQVLNILVGQKGANAYYSGGGGGGTYVWDAATGQPLVIAGGGGGVGSLSAVPSRNNGIDASVSEMGTNGNGITSGSGINGNGGAKPSGVTKFAAGGAGWNTVGANGSTVNCSIQSTGGFTALSGGSGGNGGGINSSFSYLNTSANGGYGGGGGANACTGAGFGGGGGGGYSGGGAGVVINGQAGSTGGGGGGSFNSGINQTNQAGAIKDNGSAKISWSLTLFVEAHGAKPSGSFFPIGTTEQIFRLTDGDGNYFGTGSFKITVKDGDAPIVSQPISFSACRNSDANNKEYDLTGNKLPAPFDMCSGINEIKYQVKGATIRNGKGEDASGSFNEGISTITWTVSDNAGNETSVSSMVNIRSYQNADFNLTSSEEFCDKVVVTGNTPINSTWKWSKWTQANMYAPGGFTTVTTDNHMILDNVSSGSYRYELFDKSTSCGSIAEYHYSSEDLINNYTIVATNSIVLDEQNEVVTGSVGVTKAKDGKIELKRFAKVSGTNAKVKATEVKVDNNALCNAVLAPASVGLPPAKNYVKQPGGMKDLTVKVQPTAPVDGDYKNVSVKKNMSVILTGSTFSKISLEAGASVTFTESEVYIYEIVTKGSAGQPCKFNFSGPSTNVMVGDKVSFGQYTTVNENGNKVVFYLADAENKAKNFEVEGPFTEVTANVCMPVGSLKVSGTGASHTVMNGMYMVENVAAGKFVKWTGGSICSSIQNGVYSGAATRMAAPILLEALTVDFKVSAYPNPSSGVFQLEVRTKETTPISVRILDAAGRPVENLRNVQPNLPSKFGAALPKGTYLVEVQQGNERKLVKLLKM